MRWARFTPSRVPTPPALKISTQTMYLSRVCDERRDERHNERTRVDPRAPLPPGVGGADRVDRPWQRMPHKPAQRVDGSLPQRNDPHRDRRGGPGRRAQRHAHAHAEERLHVHPRAQRMLRLGGVQGACAPKGTAASPCSSQTVLPFLSGRFTGYTRRSIKDEGQVDGQVVRGLS
jgi:hypothetical protein